MKCNLKSIFSLKNIIIVTGALVLVSVVLCGWLYFNNPAVSIKVKSNGVAKLWDYAGNNIISNKFFEVFDIFIRRF
jgi:hypothetical protein